MEGDGGIQKSNEGEGRETRLKIKVKRHCVLLTVRET